MTTTVRQFLCETVPRDQTWNSRGSHNSRAGGMKQQLGQTCKASSQKGGVRTCSYLIFFDLIALKIARRTRNAAFKSLSSASPCSSRYSVTWHPRSGKLNSFKHRVTAQKKDIPNRKPRFSNVVTLRIQPLKHTSNRYVDPEPWNIFPNLNVRRNP